MVEPIVAALGREDVAVNRNLAVWLAAILVVAGRAFITPRLNVPTVEGLYESFAHLFVGFLILVRLYDPREKLGPTRDMAALGWLLAGYELVFFLVQKFA